MTQQPPFAVGIDVGGTFTDFVLHEPGGRVTRHKEPSTPDDPSRAVGEGLEAVMRLASVPRDAPGVVLHGTTIALNAVLQGRGAPIALVVSRGNRDVLEIGRARMPSSFNFALGKERPVVPRDRVIECTTRLGADGRPVAEADAAELDALAERIRVLGVPAVAIMLVNSHVGRDAEAALAAELGRRLPGVDIVASAEIWPEIREYERALIAVLNAQITPLMGQYLARLERRLHAAAEKISVFVTASNGGVLGLATARGRPIDTILSGPASGVTAAVETARAVGIERIVTFDMGGTSTDLSVVRYGAPEFTSHTLVGDLPVILPSVDVSAIGAGGGSIVHVDAQGLVKVGPASAGADPGPVAYGRGGKAPTVTDCYVANGWIDPTHFLGGRMRLDRDAARSALAALGAATGQRDLAKPEAIAAAALRIATARMATGMLRHLAQKGEDAASFTLVPFGGAGPTQAAFLAEETGIRRILVPPAASTFCALGAVLSRVKRAYAASLGAEVRDPRSGAVRPAFADLEIQARRWIAGEGALLSEPSFALAADMRYRGQAFNVEVAVPDAVGAGDEADTLYELFHREHEGLYGFREERGVVEVVTVRLTVSAEISKVALTRLDETAGPAEPQGSRDVYVDGAWQSFAIYRRAALPVGAQFSGPAIVEQEDTTVSVPSAWSVAVDAYGNLAMERAR